MTPARDGEAGTEGPLHVPDCKKLGAFEVVTGPLCNQRGEVAARIEDASCSTSTTFAARVASFRNVTHRPQKDRTASPARIGGNVPAHHRVSCPVHAGARHAGDLVDHHGLYGTGCRRRRRAPDTGH